MKLWTKSVHTFEYKIIIYSLTFFYSTVHMFYQESVYVHHSFIVHVHINASELRTPVVCKLGCFEMLSLMQEIMYKSRRDIFFTVQNINKIY